MTGYTLEPGEWLHTRLLMTSSQPGAVPHSGSRSGGRRVEGAKHSQLNATLGGRHLPESGGSPYPTRKRELPADRRSTEVVFLQDHSIIMDAIGFQCNAP